MPTRTTLRLNATLSLAMGALIAAIPSAVGGWLGVDLDGWLRALGVGLVGHGIALLVAAGHEQVERGTRVNLLLIAPYPLLLVVLVVAGLIPRPLGRVLALGDAAAVGTIAWLQWRSLAEGSVAAPV